MFDITEASPATVRAVLQESEIERVRSIVRRVDLEAPAPATVEKTGPPADPTFFLSERHLRGFNAFREPQKQHAYVYKCIDVRCRNIAQVPQQVHRITAGERIQPRTQQILNPNHPLVLLFSFCNTQHDFAQLLRLWENMMMLDGECFWVWQRMSGAFVSQGEIPRQVWPIRGVHMEHKFNDSGTDISHWIYTPPNSMPQRIERWQVTQFKYPDPNNPFRGISPLAAALAAARQDHKAQVWNEANFDNSSMPLSAVSYPDSVQVNDDQKRKQMLMLNQLHGGAGNNSRLAILDQGAKWQRISDSPREMDWIALRGWNRDEIRTVFGVSKFELGLDDDVNRATASQSKGLLFDRELIPDLRILTSTLRKTFMQWSGAQDAILLFDLEAVDALKEALKEKLDNCERAIKVGIPINRAIELSGIPTVPVPGGNVSLIPTGFQTLEEVTNPLPPMGSPSPDGDDDEEEEDLDDDGTRPVFEREETPSAPSYVPQDASVFYRMVASTCLSASTKTFKAKIRRHWFDTRNSVLKRLEQICGLDVRTAAGDVPARSRLHPSKVDHVLGTKSAWDHRLCKLLSLPYRECAERSIQTVESELRTECDVSVNTPETFAFLENRKIAICTLNGGIRSVVRGAMRQAIKDGLTLSDLWSAISRTFDLAAQRSNQIARSEVGCVANTIRNQCHAKHGVVETRWLSDEQEALNPHHKAEFPEPVEGGIGLSGQRVHLGRTFSNGLRHPCDSKGREGEIGGCQCLAQATKVAPVNDEEDHG